MIYVNDLYIKNKTLVDPSKVSLNQWNLLHENKSDGLVKRSQ